MTMDAPQNYINSFRKSVESGYKYGFSNPKHSSLLDPHAMKGKG
jgi:hypothetical protein